VILLDLKGTELYQMNGAKSSNGERIKAAQLVQAIRDEREGRAKVHVAEQGDGDKDFWPTFWQAFGGEGPISDESGSDSQATVQSEHTRRLMRLQEQGDGVFHFAEVATGHFDKGALDSNDVFIVDAGQEVFVWIGKGSSPRERRNGIQYAQKYLVDFNRPKALPIHRILEGGENEVFETLFKIF
jgi:hypothetical protein